MNTLTVNEMSSRRLFRVTKIRDWTPNTLLIFILTWNRLRSHLQRVIGKFRAVRLFLVYSRKKPH